MAARRDFDSASNQVDAVLARTPNAHDAWQLKGDLLAHAKGDVAGAIQAYQRAVSLRRNSLAAHSGIVYLLLARKDFAAAAQQVAEMKKVLVSHPQTKYLEAQVALGTGDYKTAKDLAAQLLKMAPKHPHLLQLAGVVEFHARSQLQAQAFLHEALQASPDLRPARLFLARSYLRTGQPARSLSTLLPLLQQRSDDAEALSLAGEAHLQNEDVRKAEASFSQAAKLNPDDHRSRTALALVRLSKGEVDVALRELEGIAAADRGTTANVALISAHLRRNEFDAAMKAIDKLEQKQPEKALAPYLRGVAQLGLRQVDAARQSLEQALKFEPVYFPAAAKLAQLDLADKKPEMAQARFERLLKVDAGHVDALLALAQLRARAGAGSEEVVALLTNAVKLNPSEPAPRVQLIDHHIAGNRFDVAVAAAQEAVAAVPTNPRVVDALGRAQLASGDFNQAITSFGKLAALSPESPIGHLRLADTYLASKNLSGARQSIQRALALAPDSIEGHRRLVAVELAGSRSAESLSAARAVQKRHPKSGAGYVLEGDIEGARNNWEASVAAYRAALKLQPVTPTAMRLHSALAKTGRHAEANTFAQKWSNEHPRDAAFLGYLGDLASVKEDFAAAEEKYLGVLRLQPENARALNNVAWAKVQLNAPGAISYALRANEVMPRNAAIMETLAVALASNDRIGEAIEVLHQATVAEPGNHRVRLSLAKMYVRAGQKALAKKELERLNEVGDKFFQYREVASLLAKL